MRVIEGKQIATDTSSEAKFCTPQTVSVTKGTANVTEIQTVSGVVKPTEVHTMRGVTNPIEVQLTKGVAHPVEIQTTKTITNPTEVKVVQTAVNPIEVKTVTETGSQSKRLCVANPETLPDHAPIPLHTETAKVRDLQSMAKKVNPTTGTQNIQSISVETHVPTIRNGQKGMTLEELFTAAKKEEKS